MAKKPTSETQPDAPMDMSGKPTDAPAAPGENTPTSADDEKAALENMAAAKAPAAMSRSAILEKYLSGADRDTIRAIKSKKTQCVEAARGFLFVASREAETAAMAAAFERMASDAIAGVEDRCVERACLDHNLELTREAA